MEEDNKLVNYPVIAHDVTYRAGFKKIIQDISIGIKKNEFVGVIGGSGSGKTTLLKSLSGYKTISQGKVYINGVKSTQNKEKFSLIGYVPQDDIVHSALTIEKAFLYSCKLKYSSSKDEETFDFVNSIIELMDLKEHSSKQIKSLSGGQRKRVNIGMELLHSPSLIFMDEPTSGLDPSLERQLMKFLKELSLSGKSILLTTHLMQNIDLFDLLIFVHKGHIVYAGPSEEVLPFYKVENMIDLFDKILSLPPLHLKVQFENTSLYREFVLNRLQESGYVN